MNKQRGRRHLGQGERRELRRMNTSRGSVAVYLGTASEQEAELILKEEQQAGLIENFWHIPSRSTLDFLGIDFICQTTKGYFLINTKKSSAGIMSFEQEKQRRQENNTQLFCIYPWRVILDIGKRQDAKAELAAILSKDPSFKGDSLPEDIRQELANPTYTSRQKTTISPAERLKRLKEDGIVNNLHIEKRKVWQVCLRATVKGKTLEVVRCGKYDLVEKEAYEELLRKIA